jgi:HEAT repeat protein
MAPNTSTGDPLCEALELALTAPTESAQVAGVFAAFLQHGDSAIPEQIDILDNRPELRKGIVTLFLMMRHPQTVNALIRFVQREDDVFILNRAIAALGATGDKKAIPTLAELLVHDNLETRVVAALALLEMGDDRAYEWLVGLLNQPVISINHQQSIIGVIGNRKDEGALLPLITSLSHPKLGGPAARAIRAIGQAAVPGLINVLPLVDDHVLRLITELLVELKDTRVVEPLIAIWEQSEKNSYRSVSFIVALCELADVGAVDTLIAALYLEGEEGVRRLAAGALKKIGTPKALKAANDWWENEDRV